MTPSFGLPAELAELADEYEFVEELGRGGSAVVYRARDRALGRDVAIKVVHPRPTSPDDDPVARLAREARTVAQLHHPGIVSVYAVRRLRAGGLTLVMQFVPGATLKQSIQRGGAFGAVRAEAILRDVARALAYAHARHVVHRDVKPENIFLDAESGRALLADFGIARSTEADSITMTGTAIGTPFYMSPEQVDGMPVDGRSDLYSLGLVAWEMLTGLRPWDGESLYQVIYKQKHDELPPIEAVRGDVPRRLQYIVERMLQKRPAARWAGADGLLAQLDRTILPADYAQWTAALPVRVARHRAAAVIRRPAEPRDARAAVVAAATVQFTPTRDAHPSVAPVGAAPAGSAVVPNAAAASEEPRTAAHPPAPICTALGEPLPSSVPVALPTTADTPGPVYDTVAPIWTHPDTNRAPRALRGWGRRAIRGSAVAVVGVGAVVLGARVVPRSSRLPGTVAELGFTRPTPAQRPSAVAARDIGRASASDAQTSAAGDSATSTGAELIALGAHHACSLTTGGGAECWGRNDGAQLGDGSGVTSALPRPVAGVMTYVSLAAGASHTCGVTRLGDVYCWGTNDHGQLGDGTTVPRSAPVRIGGIGTYRAVRGGAAHTCALDIAGIVRCWGDNSHGQLGDGTRAAQSLPTRVRLPSGALPRALATGAEHSCALLFDGRVLCWGSNVDGQLGVTEKRVSAEPSEVPGVRARAIAAGDAHTCAVLQSGPVRCWGRDTNGQLGSGDDAVGAPGRLTVIPGGEVVRTVVAGSAHNCVLTRDGRVWCWGRLPAASGRAPVRLGRGPYTAIAAAGAASCAVALTGVAECWRGTHVDRRRDHTATLRYSATRHAVAGGPRVRSRSGR